MFVDLLVEYIGPPIMFTIECEVVTEIWRL